MMNKKELVETLTKGRNCAKKLQTLLSQKLNDDGLVSVDDLVTEISQSFYGGLLVLNSCNSSTVPVSGHLSSGSSGDMSRNSGKTPAIAVKSRRGCYKRRRTLDSRTEVSDTIEDGYAWRKYGQKEILNSNFPRCYFRCTHKHTHGCKALRQVQKEDGTNKFHIIYFGHHTCPTPNPELDLDCKNNMNHHNLPSSPSAITEKHIDLKQDQSNEASSTSGAHSSSEMLWKEILQDEFDCFINDGSTLSDISSFEDFIISKLG